MKDSPCGAARPSGRHDKTKMPLSGNIPADFSGIYPWLIADRAHVFEPASLVIEHFDAGAPRLAPRLARRFAEIEGSKADSWFCIDEATAELARFDYTSLKLLGFDGHADHSLESVLRVLLSRGGAILEMPGALEATAHVENCFRVAIAPLPLSNSRCHIAIDPTKLRWDCLSPIVGDAFLDWRNDRKQSAISRLRHA